MAPSIPIFLFRLLTTPRGHFRAKAMKQSCYPFSKIYSLLEFQPSRLTMAPSRPIFSFPPLNKLGPLVDYFKIAMSDCAHLAQDHFQQVWSTSVNFKDNLRAALCRTADNPICSMYDVHSNNAKKKKWMPYGHQL